MKLNIYDKNLDRPKTKKGKNFKMQKNNKNMFAVYSKKY